MVTNLYVSYKNSHLISTFRLRQTTNGGFNFSDTYTPNTTATRHGNTIRPDEVAPVNELGGSHHNIMKMFCSSWWLIWRTTKEQPTSGEQTRTTEGVANGLH